MPTARMLSGGIVDPGAGQPGAVLAFVAVSGGARGSRLFRVEGDPNAPVVRELSPETTIDLRRFQRETERELRPFVEAIRKSGGSGRLAVPARAWVCQEVRSFLKVGEGLDVD